MSIAIPATSGVRNDAGARGERFYRPNWIAFASLPSLPFSFFTRAGAGDAAHFAARGVRYSRLLASAASAGRFGADDHFLLLSAYLITECLREQELCG
jgi:hypothetical protein